MDFNKEKALEYYEQENNITKAAKRHCQDLGIEYKESHRMKLSNYLKKLKDSDSDLETDTTTETIQYDKNINNMPSAWSAEKNRFFTIEEYCDEYGLDKKSVKSSKLVSHNASHMVYNIAFFTDDEEAVLDVNDNLEEIVKKYLNPIKIDAPEKRIFEYDWFDRLVYTDVHIAMDVQGKGGDPLYDGKWDKEEILSRLSQMISHVKNFKMGNTLVIDDLGDFLDGLNGQTTRKGHELPQNMSDKEAFDLALEFKISLVDSLIDDYETIICNDITNDNHSGVFSYFVSSAVKKILEQRYPGRVIVNSLKRFIHNYSIDKHTFVLSHGKDIGEQKFGFKPKLDAVQADKIDQYCKEHKLYNGNFIEFSKGDSHQAMYDDTTSNDFQYYNYPAFSPPSNWVKTNFGNSKSGFRLYNIQRKDNIKVAIPYWFS